jgi:uncharacterized protein YkwD
VVLRAPAASAAPSGVAQPGAAPPGAARPAAAQPDDRPLVPSGPEARRYEGKAATRGGPPRDPLAEAILADAREVAAQAGRPAPLHDTRLDWAMTDLARNLRGDEIPSIEGTAFLLAHHGLVEPSPHFFLARLTPGAEAEVRARAREELAAALRAGPIGRIGVGVDRRGPEVQVVAGFQETPIVLRAAVPRQLPPGGRASIEARIVGAYHDPEMVVTAPDGSTHEERTIRPPGLGVGFVCGLDGRYQVEIVATGVVGPTVLANFPLFCGVAPPAVFQGGAGMRQGPADPAAAEQQIAALVNRDRARAGVAPVTVDARLAAVARAHCQDMVQHDFLGHVSPRTGTAADRVRRAGLAPEILFENVGRAYSPDSAESGFLGSPGHRGNLLDPRARRLGVGVVFGPETNGTRALIVTQLLSS